MFDSFNQAKLQNSYSKLKDVKLPAEVVNGLYRADFTIPLAVPEKTDIDVRILADGNGTQAT